MVRGYENVFESICDKCLHSTRLLKCVIKLIEDSRCWIWEQKNHSKLDKLLDRFNIVFSIFKKFMDIGNKGNRKKENHEELFSLNIVTYRHYQIAFVINDIIAVCRILIKWVETCIFCKKLDCLIQITHRVSRVLQSDAHRRYLRNN